METPIKSLALQQALAKHPNVDYKYSTVLPPLIAPETFKTINQQKVNKNLEKILTGNLAEIERILPSLFNLKGVMEREAYDYRLTKFKRKNMIRYNQMLFKIDLNRNRVIEAEKELIEAFSEFKEAVNLSYTKHMSEKY